MLCNLLKSLRNYYIASFKEKKIALSRFKFRTFRIYRNHIIFIVDPDSY